MSVVLSSFHEDSMFDREAAPSNIMAAGVLDARVSPSCFKLCSRKKFPLRNIDITV